MLDALIGALIAVTATTALLSAVQLSESAFQKVGGSFLLDGNQFVRSDLEVLNDAGYDITANSKSRDTLEDDLSKLPSQLQ